jgi:septum formation protein
MGETERKMGSRPLVYLASGSAQRRAILEELGIPYQLLTVDVNEIVAATACETVEENARCKLLEGLRIADRGAVVLGADTVLEAQGRVLGKPADETAAMEYLQMLSGRSATAYSAVAVAVAGTAEGCLATETAEVHFKILPQDVIRWYLSTGEPMGRAGAFGIGQIGEVLTESVDGGYSCVSGLPKTALLLALASVVDAGERQDWCARHILPALSSGTRVQLSTLSIPVGHEVDHRHDDQRKQR